MSCRHNPHNADALHCAAVSVTTIMYHLPAWSGFCLFGTWLVATRFIFYSALLYIELLLTKQTIQSKAKQKRFLVRGTGHSLCALQLK